MTPSFSLLLLLLLDLSLAHPTGQDAGEEVVKLQREDADYLTGNILTANRDSKRSLSEGDLVMSETRNAIRCSNDGCLWTKGFDGLVTIPYNISSDFTLEERALIEGAMKVFEQKKTCVRFVPYSGQCDYIDIKNEDGCYSYLGRYGGGQVVSLKRSGCLYSGIIQHELLHALGFQHEQTRSDRDTYVRIHWENIISGMEDNFARQDTNNLGTPYDYSSIMHYGRTAFSRNGEDTITPIDNFHVYIGQRWAMSVWDEARINALYDCN